MKIFAITILGRRYSMPIKDAMRVMSAANRAIEIKDDNTLQKDDVKPFATKAEIIDIYEN